MEMVDVVVVGSGYGGSIPAARCAEAGMSVVVLERGARMTTAQLRQSDDLKYVQSMTDVVVSSGNVAFRTGKLVGGASIPMDGAHFRIPTKSFERKDRAGRRYWPAQYSRATMDPYYTRVEQMLRVRRFGWNEISKAGGIFARWCDKAGARCDRSIMNYLDCVQCGFCAQGCIFDKKVTLLHSYIPFAESRGATFRPGCSVSTIEPAMMGTTSGYIANYMLNGQAQQIFGRRMFVAGGGLHTPALMLRSKPNLPNLSTHVGKNFNHNGEMQFIGILPEGWDAMDLANYHCFKGMDNAGVMSFHWFDADGFTLHPGGGMEPSLFAAAVATANDPEIPKQAWGMEYKRFVEKVYPHRVFGFSSLGLADSHADVVLAADGKSPDVVDRDRTTYDQYLDMLLSRVQAAAQSTGTKVLPAYERKYSGMTSAHLLCSCRMAESVNDGVVDANCEVFNYPNLFICDASALPYAIGVNPALNISALAEKTAEFVVRRG